MRPISGMWLAIVIAACVPAAAQQNAHYGVRWDFDADAEGWTGREMDLRPQQGSLRATVLNYDPWMTSPEFRINAKRFNRIAVRLRTAAKGIARCGVYWRTDVSPAWAEPAKYFEFPIHANGDWQTYDLAIGHAAWEGNVLQLRLDTEPSGGGEGESIELDFVGIYGRTCEADFSLDAHRVVPGQQIKAASRLVAVHEALAAPDIQLEVPEGLRVVSGDSQSVLPDVAVGEEDRGEWTLVAQQEGLYTIAWTARIEGVGTLRRTAQLIVTAPEPELPPGRPSHAQARVDGDGCAVLESERLRIAFVRGKTGFTHAAVYVWDDGWQRMGSACPLGEVIWRQAEGAPIRELLSLTEARASHTRGEAQIVLRADTRDSQGATWRYELEARLADGSSDAHIRARLSCDRPRPIMRFAGPMLLAGDGSFGASKTEAMFPGLEWLVADEQSSSTLDLAPPANLRYVPHPYKVTVPVMCVEHEGRLLGLAWDPLQRWDGEQTCPMAQFCSPDWINNGAHHLMGLFVPGMGHVPENEDQALTPYELPAGKELSLRSVVTTGVKTTCLQTVWRYFDLFGASEAQAAPMTDEQQMALCDETYMERLYSEADRSWKYCFPLTSPRARVLSAGNSYYSRFATALWMDSILRDSPEARRSVRDHLIGVKQALLEGDGQWYVAPELAFRWGHVRESLLGQEHAIKGFIAGQEPDGSWGGFRPSEKTAQLGPAGKKEVGLAGWNAYLLLKYARITGNQEAFAAGLRALEHMDRFRVPRAAQTWECPVHSPDIYASFVAMMPYLEAYEITGEPRYLQQAVYWAETGLPFVYVWGAPDRPVMKGGSIAIFGASFFTCSWLGRPVQWNGMEYSWALMKLAKHDNSRPWVELATSIMRSGMWQQETDDSANAKGGYTDNWHLPANQRDKGFILSPWWILLNLHSLKGFDHEVQTAIVRTPDGDIPVSSGAKITASMDDKRLRAVLDHAEGETVYCLMAGLARPTEVARGQETLTEAQDLEAVQEGWLYMPQRAFLLIKARPTEGARTELTVTGARPRVVTWDLGEIERPAYRTPRQLAYEALPLRIAADWQFTTEDEAEWRDLPRDDLGEPNIIGGELVMTVTGPDPQIALPIDTLDAEGFSVITVEMSVDRGTQFELYFATEEESGLAEKRSAHVPTRADGTTRRYSVPMDKCPGWSGTVNLIRFDPVGIKSAKNAGATVRVRRIAISNKPLPGG